MKDSFTTASRVEVGIGGVEAGEVVFKEIHDPPLFLHRWQGRYLDLEERSD